MGKSYRSELVGVFGCPVEENPTGVMEEAAFAKMGLDYRYLTIRVEEGNLKTAMEAVKAQPDKYATAVNTYSIINDIKVLPGFYNVRNQVTNLKENVWTEIVTNPDLTAETLLPFLEKATKYAEEIAEQ